MKDGSATLRTFNVCLEGHQIVKICKQFCVNTIPEWSLISFKLLSLYLQLHAIMEKAKSKTKSQ